MQMKRIYSSTLTAIGYDITSQTLVLKSKYGTYEYYDVPEYIYENLMSSSSKGRYYDQNIKWSFCYDKIK